MLRKGRKQALGAEGPTLISHKNFSHRLWTHIADKLLEKKTETSAHTRKDQPAPFSPRLRKHVSPVPARACVTRSLFQDSAV